MPGVRPVVLGAVIALASCKAGDNLPADAHCPVVCVVDCPPGVNCPAIAECALPPKYLCPPGYKPIERAGAPGGNSEPAGSPETR